MTNWQDGFLRGKTHLLMDRDTEFTEEFRALLKGESVSPVRLPPRSPNLNAFAERWVRSVRKECLDRMIIFGERMLCRCLSEFITHYHAERNHQGLANKLIEPGPAVGSLDGEVACRERLGGLLKYYHRRAA
jgi:putative transposase